MKTILVAVRNLLFPARPPQHQEEALGAMPEAQTTQCCPAMSLCLGCDGNINCTLARLLASSTQR